MLAGVAVSTEWQGESARAKHGVRGTRGWEKLHLAVDRSGVIIAEALTEGHVDDATTALHLIDAVDGDIASVTADGAYDSIAIYDAAGARGASVVVPPTKTASVSRRRLRSTARDRTIKKVRAIGRRRWKKASGYHRQACVVRRRAMTGLWVGIFADWLRFVHQRHEASRELKQWPSG